MTQNCPGVSGPTEQVSPPAQVCVRRFANRLAANAHALIADYKSRGMTQQQAWNEFVRDRALRPEIDAKQVYALYRSVTPQPLTSLQWVDFSPTHWDALTNLRLQVAPQPSGVWELVWEHGVTGSEPAGLLPGRYVSLAELARQAGSEFHPTHRDSWLDIPVEVERHGRRWLIRYPCHATTEQDTLPERYLPLAPANHRTPLGPGQGGRVLPLDLLVAEQLPLC